MSSVSQQCDPLFGRPTPSSQCSRGSTVFSQVNTISSGWLLQRQTSDDANHSLSIRKRPCRVRDPSSHKSEPAGACKHNLVSCKAEGADSAKCRSSFASRDTKTCPTVRGATRRQHHLGSCSSSRRVPKVVEFRTKSSRGSAARNKPSGAFSKAVGDVFNPTYLTRQITDCRSQTDPAECVIRVLEQVDWTIFNHFHLSAAFTTLAKISRCSPVHWSWSWRHCVFGGSVMEVCWKHGEASCHLESSKKVLQQVDWTMFNHFHLSAAFTTLATCAYIPTDARSRIVLQTLHKHGTQMCESHALDGKAREVANVVWAIAKMQDVCPNLWGCFHICPFLKQVSQRI